ncbi:MAG: TVP38/TMEM64 family protein [Verrucomicrobiota bacterium]
MSESDQPQKKRRWILWLAIAIAIIVSFRFLPVAEWLEALETWIDSLGFWGPLVFIAIYIVATVLVLPGAAMTPLSGLLFGLGWGTLWVVIGSNIGATISFLIGRYFARDSVAAKAAENEKFAAIDEAVGREGWKIVGLTRLSPVFPFTLLNYGYGITRVKWLHFALASLVGMFPGTVMYVYFGSLGRLAGEASDTSHLKLILTIVGLVATVVVTILITRAAKKALAARTGIEADS